MEYLFNFFTPVSSELKAYCDDLPPTSVGVHVDKFVDGYEPLLPEKSLVLLSLWDESTSQSEVYMPYLNAIRKEFYRLHVGNWVSDIVDLGHLTYDTNLEHTGLILKEVLAELVKKQITPLIIGNPKTYTYFLYKSFETLEKRVNLCVVDPQFSLGQIVDKINEDTYLSHIIMDKPNNLHNFVNIGYQTYLNAQEEIALLDSMLFEAYRLGEVKNDVSLVEPVLRESDILSVSLSSVKASEVPQNNNRNINGFSAEELCRICRYAGLSDYLSIFSVFDNEVCVGNYNHSAQLLAQMLWYFTDGYHLRRHEYPDNELKNFKKYNVIVDESTLTFYKSVLSDRWWMEINADQDNKITRTTLVPCTYQDFLTANNKEVPERWYFNRKKLNA